MESVPTCIGFIMDGNRRWAKERDLPTFEGHRHGAETLKKTVEWAQENGVGHVVFYAFSTENWKRSEAEVNYLLGLIKTFFAEYRQELREKNVRVRFIGQRDRLDASVCGVIEEVEHESEHNSGITAWICLSYGGRAEITEGVNKLIQEGTSEVTEEDISEALWSAGMPDPDMIIRTSGERRLSGFLTWQSVYSELFFTDTYWPDFSKEEFHAMLEAYGERHRRHGK